MTNNSEQLPECSLSSNVSCWNAEVARLNLEFARLMVPVEVLMVTLMVVGIFGNAMVLIVYIHRNNRTTANIFIMYLAAIDLTACSVIHPYIIYKLFNNYDQTWVAACKIFEFILHANLGISGLTLLLIAIDRFLGICKPVKFLNFHKGIYKLILATFTFSVVVSLPLLEFYGPKPETLEFSEFIFVGFKCDYRDIYQDSVSRTVFSTFIMACFLSQFVAMAVLYKNVAVVAYRSRRAILPMEPASGSGGNKTGYSSGIATFTTQVSQPEIREKLSKFGISSVDRHLATAWTTDVRPNLHNKESQDVSEGRLANFNVPKVQTGVSVDSIASGRKPFSHQLLGSSTKSAVTLCCNSTNSDIRLNRTKNLSSGLKAAKILFLVTAVFLISWLPFFILRVCYTIDKSYWNDYSPARKVIEHFLNHCFYINNAINPVIYSVINKNFRQECMKLFTRACGYT